MKAKLTPVDEGAMLVLDRPLLQKLGLGGDAEVELSTNGDVLTVTPVRDEERERLFRESADKVLQKHAGLFRRLSK
jgi:antitoxin component of MazEF toxin-antitoxin module